MIKAVEAGIVGWPGHCFMFSQKCDRWTATRLNSLCVFALGVYGINTTQWHYNELARLIAAISRLIVSFCRCFFNRLNGSIIVQVFDRLYWYVVLHRDRKINSPTWNLNQAIGVSILETVTSLRPSGRDSSERYKLLKSHRGSLRFSKGPQAFRRIQVKMVHFSSRPDIMFFTVRWSICWLSARRPLPWKRLRR